jgi:hypothetical protein
MPSSVTAMLAVADLTHLETARWGVRPTFDGAGVYLVALAEHPELGVDCQTQDFTCVGIGRCCIRVTSSAKRLLSLPPRASEIRIHLRGQPMTCAWDARLGLDRERSGLLRVGRERLTEVVHDMPTRLALRVTADGEIHLD